MSSGDFRILITGGGGFVGRHIACALRRILPQSEILAVDRGSASAQGAATAALDVTDADAVTALLKRERPTHVLHLAAIASVRQASSDARQTWDVNFGGTLNVALAISEVSPESRLVFCSSAEVYGASFRTQPAVAEDTPIAPENSYGASKAAAEILIGQLVRQGMRAIIFRPFNHTGAGQSDSFALPAFASQLVQIERGTRPPRLNVGDLSPRRDFLDVRDVVDAYARGIQRFDSLPNGSVMNLASGTPRAIGEILQSLIALTGIDVEVLSDPRRIRANEIPLMVGKADRAGDLLGWRPQYSWTETLQSVLDDWRRRVA